MQHKRPIKSLIIAELDDGISVQEKEILYKWISKSEKNARYYTRIKDLWEASLANASDLAQTSREWERFTRRLIAQPQKSKKSLSINKWYRVAAVVAISLLVASQAIQYFKTGEPVYITSVAPQGSVSQTILPDGTMIYLNAGSEIKYDVNPGGKSREVSIKGEAWFDVQRNEKKPFIVHTSYYDVKVLGTRFNVKAYEDEETVATTLEEGSVCIRSTDKFKIKEELTLRSGEQLTFNKSNRKLQLKKVDTRLFTSWKENKLIFLEMSFADLVKLLERKYGVEIVVADKSILNEHYSGTIKNETIMEILNIIQYTHPVQYRIEGQKIVINKK